MGKNSILLAVPISLNFGIPNPKTLPNTTKIKKKVNNLG